MTELTRQITLLLIDFEKSMSKELHDGKRAVLLIMFVNDMEQVFYNHIELLKTTPPPVEFMEDLKNQLETNFNDIADKVISSYNKNTPTI